MTLGFEVGEVCVENACRDWKSGYSLVVDDVVVPSPLLVLNAFGCLLNGPLGFCRLVRVDSIGWDDSLVGASL